MSTALMSAVFIGCSFALAISLSCEPVRLVYVPLGLKPQLFSGPLTQGQRPCSTQKPESINNADRVAAAEFLHTRDEAAVWQDIIAFRLHYHHEIAIALHVK